jgi:foldase protein PrsA
MPLGRFLALQRTTRDGPEPVAPHSPTNRSIMPYFHRSLAVVAAAVLSVTFAACANSGSSGDVVAVNGQRISRAEFDRKLESGAAAKQVLSQLVQQQLVDQYGKESKIEISQADIDKKEADIKAQYPPGQFEQILAQQGLTEADVKNILRQQIILERAVTPQVKVTDAEIQAYFNKNHAQLDKPERVRARHILVADAKTAETVEGKLKGGMRFEDAAKAYSTDPSSKDKGGELGFFGRGTMVPPFQDAAFSLPVGQVSQPVKSPFGFHIIQVEEHQNAQKATLAGSRDEIVKKLTQQAQGQQIPAFLQQLRSKAKIDIYDDRYKDLFPPPPAPPAPAK